MREPLTVHTKYIDMNGGHFEISCGHYKCVTCGYGLSRRYTPQQARDMGWFVVYIDLPITTNFTFPKEYVSCPKHGEHMRRTIRSERMVAKLTMTE